MSDSLNDFLIQYNQLSHWEIHIDDLCGELAMIPVEKSGMKIDVLSVEEIIPIIAQLKQELKRERECVDALMKQSNTFGQPDKEEWIILVKKSRETVAQRKVVIE